METRVVFHIDFDYFYAQCEEVRKPELKTRPVCVCIFSDRGGDSGAIATANYRAREFGVKSGLSIISAKQKLDEIKDAVYLPADFEYYTHISKNAMDIMQSFADIFEYVGRDEAYLDVTKRTNHSFDRASHIAQQIKNSIRDKLGLSCSIGISPNKLLSKMASDYNKPDGLTLIKPHEIEEFLNPQSVRAIPGIGKKTEERFAQMGLQTISDLKKLDIFSLNKEFGRKTSTHIFNAARGLNDEAVKEREANIQYSKIVTLKRDSNEFDFLSKSIPTLCNELYTIIQKNNMMFKSVGIQFVQSDMTSRTKSRLLKNSTSSLDELEKNALYLLKDALNDQVKAVRRLGIKVSDLSKVKGQADITDYF